MTRLALIGKGRWGKNIIRTLEQFDDVSLVVLGRGESVPENIDGVIVATPISTHFQLSLPLIQKRIPLLIEKPVTGSVREAELLLAAAKKSRSLVHVGHIHLHNPAFQKVQEFAKKMGPIQYALFEGFNNGPFRSDASVLWDWLPHPLSMAFSVFPTKVTSVQAWGLSVARPKSRGLYDVGVVRCNFGTSALISTISCVSPEKRTKLTLIGKKNAIVYDDVAAHKLTLFEGSWPSKKAGSVTANVPLVSNPDFEAGAPLQKELRAFVDSIQKKSRDYSDLSFALETVRVMALVHESIKKGGKLIPVRK